MPEDYSKNKIKDYQYWGVFIHPNQSYLGRCVIWCNREDALDLTDATEEEQKELFIIVQDLRGALLKAFNPDWFNYSFLGNIDHHLHGHFIPRYSREIIFEDMTFKDKEWGNNYRTDHEFSIPEPVLRKIQEKIKENLTH
jgi:diadenosine tetraphosphate (Ap4A) HIT family hydrolase